MMLFCVPQRLMCGKLSPLFVDVVIGLPRGRGTSKGEVTVAADLGMVSLKTVVVLTVSGDENTGGPSGLCGFLS